MVEKLLVLVRLLWHVPPDCTPKGVPSKTFHNGGEVPFLACLVTSRRHDGRSSAHLLCVGNSDLLSRSASPRQSHGTPSMSSFEATGLSAGPNRSYRRELAIRRVHSVADRQYSDIHPL